MCGDGANDCEVSIQTNWNYMTVYMFLIQFIRVKSSIKKYSTFYMYILSPCPFNNGFVRM